MTTYASGEEARIGDVVRPEGGRERTVLNVTNARGGMVFFGEGLGSDWMPSSLFHLVVRRAYGSRDFGKLTVSRDKIDFARNASGSAAAWAPSLREAMVAVEVAAGLRPAALTVHGPADQCDAAGCDAAWRHAQPHHDSARKVMRLCEAHHSSQALFALKPLRPAEMGELLKDPILIRVSVASPNEPCIPCGGTASQHRAMCPTTLPPERGERLPIQCEGCGRLAFRECDVEHKKTCAVGARTYRWLLSESGRDLEGPPRLRPTEATLPPLYASRVCGKCGLPACHHERVS